MTDHPPDAVPDPPKPAVPSPPAVPASVPARLPDDEARENGEPELTDPVPITVWHVPAPPAAAVMSAQLARRLTVNYSPRGGTVVDLTTGHRPRTPPAAEAVALVITSWPHLAPGLAEHVAGCAARLAPGGCLAVVVANDDIPDLLGRIVVAARAAGLTYLQHVVAAHHLPPPPSAGPRDGLRGRRPSAGPGAGERQLRVHTDVLVFRQPRPADD